MTPHWQLRLRLLDLCRRERGTGTAQVHLVLVALPLRGGSGDHAYP